MNATTIQLAVLLAAACVLLGINVAAVALHVPLVSATTADAVAALIALAGLLIKDSSQAP